MAIGIKDGIKLVGIAIIFFCAVFVCTFFLNYYFDALDIGGSVVEETKILYDAQLASAKFTCIITGAVLALIAVVMLVFYIKLFIDTNSKRLGILKAMGYSDRKIAAKFWVFGLSVFVGALLGYGLGHAAMPFIYKEMTISGLTIEIHYHVCLLFALVVAPTVLFSVLACGYARLALRKNLTATLKGGYMTEKPGKSKMRESEKERPFLTEMCFGVLKSKKAVVFFVAFACFCFSAMLQMGLSMSGLSSVTMGVMILAIGLVIAVTALIMAVTTVVRGNIKNIAIMKAFGYSAKERVTAILIGYIPFAVLGFIVGTFYQYGLLSIMVNVVYGEVESIPEYGFDVAAFFITLGAFVLTYTAAMLYYAMRINKISVKAAMSEE